MRNNANIKDLVNVQVTPSVKDSNLVLTHNGVSHTVSKSQVSYLLDVINKEKDFIDTSYLAIAGEDKGSREKYKQLVSTKMRKWGIDEITDLSEARKKAFFNEVDTAWNSDAEPGKDGRTTSMYVGVPGRLGPVEGTKPNSYFEWEQYNMDLMDAGTNALIPKAPDTASFEEITLPKLTISIAKLMGQVNYKRGDRVLVNEGTAQSPELWTGTVSVNRAGKVHVNFDDNMVGSYIPVKSSVGLLGKISSDHPISHTRVEGQEAKDLFRLAMACVEHQPVVAEQHTEELSRTLKKITPLVSTGSEL